MKYTIEYLLDNFDTLPVEQHFEILAHLSVADKQLYRQRAFSMPSEVTRVDNQRAARSHNITMANLSRTPEQYKYITRKAMETMGPDGIRERQRKIVEVRGHESYVKQGKDAAAKLGVKGRSARARKIAESKKVNGTFEKSIERASEVRILNKLKQRHSNLPDDKKELYLTKRCPHCNYYVRTGLHQKKINHLLTCEAKAKGIVLKKSNYNNGTISRQFFPGTEPEGFVPGRLPLKKK
jgi:hypothetical protein